MHICTKINLQTGKCKTCFKRTLGFYVALKGEHRMGHYYSYHTPRADGLALIKWQSVQTLGGKFAPIEPYYSLVPVSKLYDPVSV